jgi:hypothetical protein
MPPSVGSAAVSAEQGELFGLVMGFDLANRGDIHEYPAISELDTVSYVPHVGGGHDLWESGLIVQSPNAVTNTVTVTFYGSQGDVLYQQADDLPPYGIQDYAIGQLPGLGASYQGSAIVSATMPVATLVSKVR